jgi:hypothetical protein
MVGFASTFRLCAAVLVVAATAILPGTVHAANLLELNFGLSGPRYEAKVPLCEDYAVASKIAGRFSEKEGRFWNSALQIVGIENVRELAFRPGHYARIPRRYCQATALINDGTRHAIYYGIGEDTGLIGITWGVEWCVVGLDRNWAYNPACKAAKP